MSAWKPGDIGASSFGRSIYIGSCRIAEHGRDGGACWHNDSGFSDPPNSPRRPLVVIDPEDMTQVERLFAAFRAKLGMRSIQNGLRELLDASNRPDEPQNIGAVVVDALGRRYVRGATKCCSGHWTQAAMDHFIDWSAFDAVRVLSTGVEGAGDE